MVSSPASEQVGCLEYTSYSVNGLVSAPVLLEIKLTGSNLGSQGIWLHLLANLDHCSLLQCVHPLWISGNAEASRKLLVALGVRSGPLTPKPSGLLSA